MATGDVKRKLTAIFSADVEGYSRLMEEDELATVETLTSHKETMGKLIRQYRGRVVDSTGDNLLAEFASVVDAVQCAVEVQQVLSAKNEALPENRRMNFRIGINSGDVIEEGDLIYGDGVNVAARVESLAEGGGISISGTAYDQLGKKLPLGYEYLGEQTVKNIEKPVRVYRVLTEAEAAGKVIGEEKPKPKHLRWAVIGALAVLIIGAGVWAIWNFYLRPQFEPASVERMALPLPEKPSIAVLPFDNLTGDPNQEYLADGITETIITALSKVPQLFVIDRNSTFTYKGKSVKVRKVSEDLGVQYVLEGSVQKSGDKMRLTVQLVDALAGHHRWAERYDRTLSDIFGVQDELAIKIMTAMQVSLTEGDMAYMISRCAENVDAYLKILKGRVHTYRFSREGSAMARQLYEEAVALDPNNTCAWGYLAWTHFTDARYGFTESRTESFKKAVEFSQKALALDPEHGGAHSLLGYIYLFQQKHEKAIAEGERALSLDPNNAAVNALYGAIMFYSGRFEEALSLSKKAMRLNPYYPNYYLKVPGSSYICLGRFDDAIATFKQLLERTRGKFDSIWAHEGLARCYLELGRQDEANAHVEEMFKVKPDVSLEWFRRFFFYKDPVHLERRLEALRRAGVPETPPLPLPDKPSIAVLPFVNMSGDPEQEYFGDGLTEEIITALSKTPELFVIARNSTFTYKGKPVKVQQVGRELGVKYVLEGSVRKAEDRVRITAQLVNAQTSHHLWAERYDRELKEIFALQDEITMKILTALQVKLTEGEQARILAKGTENLKAYLKSLEARKYFRHFNKDDNLLARQTAKEVISLDPKYSNGYVLLGGTHYMDVWYCTSKSPKQSLALAENLASKALALDESSPIAHRLLSSIYLLKRQHEKAIAEGKRAIALCPNGADELAAFGHVLTHAGEAEEAIKLYERAIRLNPIPPSWYYFQLGQSYIVAGQFEKAVAECNKAIQKEPNNLWAFVNLAASYGSLGREEDARAAAAEILRIDPNFSLEYFAKTLPYKNKADNDHFINALGKAGLK